MAEPDPPPAGSVHHYKTYMIVKLFISSKRLRFIIASLLITLGLAYVGQLSPASQLRGVCLLPIAALVVANLVLGGTSGIERMTLLTLPALLTLGAGFSQLFFPNFTIIFKVGGWVSFFLAFYTTLLAVNVFKVIRAKGESIPLERVARPTVYLLSFVVVFLLLTALYKLSFGIWLEAPVVFVTGFVVSLCFLWALTLSDLFERMHLWGSLLVGAGLVQISIAFSFYPWEAFLRGLVEATFFYALLGVARAFYEKHLKYSIAFEYIAIVLIVFFIARVF